VLRRFVVPGLESVTAGPRQVAVRRLRCGWLATQHPRSAARPVCAPGDRVRSGCPGAGSTCGASRGAKRRELMRRGATEATSPEAKYEVDVLVNRMNNTPKAGAAGSNPAGGTQQISPSPGETW
jgi:hypothetical protein